ncbi:MAG: hypothetical protein CVV50_00990 [Spirochaetae bacterium HGW-Spirochaetae-6]|nr:MAG: hypothetical protein CVV50_00990 [Spirochaetae bacterium HGW-Spirochaetae-6]
MKKCELNKSIAGLFLAFLSISFLALYYFFPLGQLYTWVYILVILGFCVPIFFISMNFFPPVLVLIFFVLVFNHRIMDVFAQPGLDLLDFFLQWGFFLWGMEMGNKLNRGDFSWRRMHIRLVLIIVLAALAFLLLSWQQALWLALMASYMSHDSSKEGVSGNFLVILFTMLFMTLSISWTTGMWFLIYAGILFILYSLYDIFLSKKVSLRLFLFFLSFVVVIFSFSVEKSPVFIYGYAAGALFLYQRKLVKNFFMDFYKYFLIGILLCRLDWDPLFLLMGLGLTMGVFLLHWAGVRKWEVAVGHAVALELPLSLLYVASQLGVSQIVMYCVFFSLVLVSLLYWRRNALIPVL